MPYEETGPEGPASSSFVDGQTDKAQVTSPAVESPTMTVGEVDSLDPMTIAEGLTQARQALGEYLHVVDRQDLRSVDAIIDYGYRWLVDKPFQTIYDDPPKGWSHFITQVLGTTDEELIVRFHAELALIRERLPALGKQSSQPPGDQWMSPGRMVCSWPDLDITARAVLFVMAAHGNNKGEDIWISQQKIAGYLGLKHKRTAQKATKRLRQAGAITKTAEPRQHKPTTYKINHGPRVT